MCSAGGAFSGSLPSCSMGPARAEPETWRKGPTVAGFKWPAINFNGEYGARFWPLFNHSISIYLFKAKKEKKEKGMVTIWVYGLLHTIYDQMVWKMIVFSVVQSIISHGACVVFIWTITPSQHRKISFVANAWSGNDIVDIRTIQGYPIFAKFLKSFELSVLLLYICLKKLSISFNI